MTSENHEEKVELWCVNKGGGPTVVGVFFRLLTKATAGVRRSREERLAPFLYDFSGTLEHGTGKSLS